MSLERLGNTLYPQSPLTSECPAVRLDPYKCRSILHGGSWSSNDPNRPYRRWSPDDCRLHEQSGGEVSDCLAGRRIVFVGDSWMRQLYWATAARLDHTKQEIAVLDFYLEEDKQRDLSFNKDGVYVEFIWDPWLNSTAFTDQLDKFRKVPESVSFGTEAKISPGLLVVGSPGLWAARHGGDSYTELFRNGVDKLLPYMKDDLDTVQMSHTKGTGRATEWLPNQLFVVPVPVPNYKRLTRARRETITPDKITAMNDYLRRWPASAQTHMPWVFNKMFEGDPGAYSEDGIHVARDIRERAVSVLLNERCNPGLKPDLQRTTSLGCISYERPGVVQLCLLIASVAIAALVLVKREDTAMTAAIEALAPMGFAAVLSYLAERTHIFIKSDRLQSGVALPLLLMGFVVASVASLRRFSGEAVAQCFMPREHTNEWKGFLQALILLLNFFDASSSLAGHKLLRLAVGTYIFLSCYGHATYFLTTGDYSFRRVGRVLLRLNLLNGLITFAVNSSYTTYYFTPLISICFLATYAILAFRRQDNDNIGILLGKVAASALVVNVVVFPIGLVKHAINLTNTLSRSSWDSWKMNQELTKDRLIPFVGILAACVAHHAGRLRSDTAKPAEDRASTIINGLILKVSDARLQVGKFQLGLFQALNLGVLVSLSVTLSDLLVRSKETYNALHPFLSPLLILPATSLRSSAPFRSTYLALPASLGSIALETYILHHHTWLSSRGTTLLSLWAPSANPLGAVFFYTQRVLMTILFFWLASAVHEATRGAVGLLLGPDPAPEEERAERGEKRLKIGGKISFWGDFRGRVLGVVVLVWLGNLLYGL